MGGTFRGALPSGSYPTAASDPAGHERAARGAVNLRVTWEGEVIAIDAPPGATVGTLRSLLAHHPDEIWVGDRRFADHEQIGHIPNGSALCASRGEARSIPVVEEGRVSFHRPPRITPMAVPPPVPPPEFPRIPDRRVRFRWAAAAVPLTAGLVLAVVFGPMMAAFSLIGVLMAAGSWLEERLALSRERRAAYDAIRKATVHHERARVARRKQVEVVLGSRLPGPDRVAALAASRARELWQRRPSHPDFGMVSVGRSNDGLPIEIALAPLTTVGIAGAAALGLARWVVAQAVVHHGPADVAVRGPSAPEWAWLGWLPHLATGAGLEVAVDELGGERRCGIVVTDDPDRLPGVCDLVIETDTQGLVKAVGSAEGTVRCGRVLTIREEDAIATARALACLRDPDAPVADGPVSLDELLETPTASSIAEAWRHHDTGLVARIGSTTKGPLELDLVGHGPHALLAGTTGSGKSELLRSLVIALAVRYPPDHVAFVLVDFKGGATFDPCRRLPHVAGSMTDLDTSGAERALEALRAEVSARERCLRQAGVASLEPKEVGTPRLLVVVDEFGALADQAPGTLDGLIDLARRGRSLGIHLLLATQRPAGVVSDRIRANTSIRIALRVHSSADSQDVINSDDAAHVDRRRPGSGFARLGPGELIAFTTGFVSGSSGEVRVGAGGALSGGDDRLCDLDRIVDAVCGAAEENGRLPADPIWTDWLPASIRSNDLQSQDGIPIGLVDDPRRRRPLVWAGENILVVDPTGSDASRTLAGVATAACSHGVHVHIAGVRQDSPLWRLTSLVGNVVGIGEVERTRRLVRYLNEEIDRRRVALTSDPSILIAVEELDVGEWLERIIKEGPALGVGVIASIRHAGAVGGAILAGFPERLAFRLLDPYEYLALGIGSIPELPRGAAFSMAHQRVVRVVEPEYDLAAPSKRPPHIGALPLEVPISSIHGMACTDNGTLFIPIGLGGTSTIGPMGFHVDPGRHIVITGPPGSGKSTALQAVAESVEGVIPTGQAKGRRIVLIDDAHRLDEVPVDVDSDLHLVVAARAGDLPHGHWVRRLAFDAAGLSLQPDQRDEDFWRMRLPGAQPPGRGVVLRRGVGIPIQVASSTMHPKLKEDQCEFG